jgi:hypothetical protein
MSPGGHLPSLALGSFTICGERYQNPEFIVAYLQETVLVIVVVGLGIPRTFRIGVKVVPETLPLVRVSKMAE